MTKRGHTYNPKNADFWKMHVGMAAKDAMKEAPTPLSGPLILEIEFRMPRPKRLRKADVDIPHTCRPDTDNLVKSTQDALQMASVVGDDSIFFDVHAVKYYSNPDDPSFARIRIIQAPDPLND
tara:strand:- start:2322 stop:2690 length:369 start_codon:yes stop_codon:yes gene_type:complete